MPNYQYCRVVNICLGSGWISQLSPFLRQLLTSSSHSPYFSPESAKNHWDIRCNTVQVIYAVASSLDFLYHNRSCTALAKIRSLSSSDHIGCIVKMGRMNETNTHVKDKTRIVLYFTRMFASFILSILTMQAMWSGEENNMIWPLLNMKVKMNHGRQDYAMLWGILMQQSSVSWPTDVELGRSKCAANKIAAIDQEHNNIQSTLLLWTTW